MEKSKGEHQVHKKKSISSVSKSIDKLRDPGDTVAVIPKQAKCIKCDQLSKKVKTVAQTTRNLQRQNGCLESIISQKRSLVEQLTKQIRGLLKENFLLAKSNGLVGPFATLNLPSTLSALQAAGLIVDNPPPGQKSKHSLIPPSTAPSKIRHGKASGTDQDCLTIKHQRKCRKKSSSSNEISTINNYNCNISEDGTSTSLDNSESSINIDLEVKCQQLEQECNKTKAGIQNTQRFLNDLLYTLNARGYESVIDYDGFTVDLFKSKGDHLLELKGRDARQRITGKRSNPHEALFKAIIGSQENAIRNLVVKLDNQNKDSIASRLSMEKSRPSSSNVSSPYEDSFENGGASNAELENEVLALVGLIEGACHRNPDLYNALKEQYKSDCKAHYGARHIVIDAVLERCEKVLYSSSPTSPCSSRVKGKERLNPRSGTPTPLRPSSSVGKSLLKQRGRSLENSMQMHMQSHQEHTRGTSSKSTTTQMQGLYNPPEIPGSNLSPPPSAYSALHTQRPSTRHGSYSFRAATPTYVSFNGPLLDINNNNDMKLNGFLYRKRYAKCQFCGQRFANATVQQLEAHLATHAPN